MCKRQQRAVVAQLMNATLYGKTNVVYVAVAGLGSTPLISGLLISKEEFKFAEIWVHPSASVV